MLSLSAVVAMMGAVPGAVNKPVYFEACPECGAEIRGLVQAVTHRNDDDQPVCRVVVLCVNEHVYWRWLDRVEMPLKRDDTLKVLFDATS